MEVKISPSKNGAGRQPTEGPPEHSHLLPCPGLEPNWKAGCPTGPLAHSRPPSGRHRPPGESGPQMKPQSHLWPEALERMQQPLIWGAAVSQGAH